MNSHALRAFLMQWQFWALEAQFAFLLVTTTVEVRRVRVRGSTRGRGVCSWPCARGR